MRILYVEHNESDADLTRREFEKYVDSLELETVCSSREAHNRLKLGATYDVVLVYLHLPDGDALSVLSLVREDWLPTKVIVLTDPGKEEAAIAALKAGADYYVVKSKGYQKRLPRVVGRIAEGLDATKAPSAKTAEKSRPINVLYGERNEDDLALVEKRLKHYTPRISLDVVGSCDDVLERLAGQNLPDILLLDYRLSGMNAFQLVKEIREVRGLDIPIIIVACQEDEEEAAQATKIGANDYVIKTIARLHRLPITLERAFSQTELARERNALRRSEETHRIISGLISDYAYVLNVTEDGNLVCEWLSESFERRFGYTLSEVAGIVGWQNLLHKEDAHVAAEHTKKVIAGESDEAEFRFVAHSGEQVWLRDYAKPVWDSAHDRVVKIYGASQDLTGQKAAEVEMRRFEARFRDLADSLPQPIFETDISGKITFTNRVSFEMFRAAEEDFKRGATLFEFVSPSDFGRAKENFGKVLRGEKTEPKQYTVVRKDGSAFPVMVSASAITHGTEVVGMRLVLIDMTEVNASQEAIRASENRYRLLFESFADEIFIMDEEGTFLQVNQAACEELGYSREEIIGRKVGEILPVEMRNSEKDRIRQIFRDGDATFESAHLRKDGSIVPVEVHCRLITLDGRKTMLSVVRDLAERKRAEAAIHESEGKFRTLVESSLVGVYIIRDLKFVYANPAMSKIYGYTEQELMSMPSIIQTIAPEDRGKVIENIRKRVENEVESIKYSFHGVRKDGEIIELEVFGSRTTFEGMSAIIGTLEDVTERRQAEQRLRDSEERYRVLFEESLDAIYVSTPSGRMIDINSAGVKLFGFSFKDDLLNVSDVSEFYGSKSDREKFKQALETQGFVRDYELKILRRDGQRLIVMDTASAIFDAAGNVIAYRGILRDITEKRRLEEQLLQSQKLESLGQLTSGIAHDFNNVLGGIMGFTELAIGKVEEDHPVHNYLIRIYGLADRAAKITKQLLAFARRQILMPKDLNLNELIADLLELLQRLLGEHVQISFAPSDDLKTVHADPSQIEQVLINLAVNGGDSMAQGGTLMIETGNVFLDEQYCRVHTDVRPGEYVMVSVSDTGVGIDASTMQHIFEPFFTTKGVGKGTGLGLAVVHGIVQQHGGSINVYSEPGQGTIFKIYFPAIVKAAEKTAQQASPARNFRTGDETILVVEDNDELREFIRILLVENGYSVLTANEGEDGVSVFVQHADEISLVVTDVVMPKLSGRKLREKINNKCPGKKFMFISGYTGTIIDYQFLHDPQVGFLQKPFTAFEFTEKVRKLLDTPSA